MGGDRVTTPPKGNRPVLESKDPNENVPMNSLPSRSFVRVGSRVDVKDTYNYWLDAVIAEISDEKKAVLVHFLHWPSHAWDAWYSWDSTDIQEYGTHRWVPNQPLRVRHWLDILDNRSSISNTDSSSSSSSSSSSTSTATATVHGVWRAAQIIEIQPNAHRLRIRYRGFNESYDEWLYIPEDAYRIAEFETRTRKIFPYVPRKQKYWKHRQRQIIFDGKTDPRILQYLTTLQSKGYTLRPMGGDGNCLFRSFADQVYGNQEYHTVCRHAAADYMTAESHFFAGFVVERPEGFTGYINDIRKDGTWGDDPEIQALCEIYNRPAEIWAYDPVEGAKPIRVFHSDSTNSSKTNTQSAASSSSTTVSHPPVRLSYFGGGHYDSLQGKDWEQNFLKKPVGEQEQLMIQAAQSRRQSLGSALNTDNVDDALLAAALQASRSQLEAQQDANVDTALLLSLGIDPSIIQQHTIHNSNSNSSSSSTGNTPSFSSSSSSSSSSSPSSSSSASTLASGIPSLEALEAENVRLAIERSQENKDDEDMVAVALRESLTTLQQTNPNIASSSDASSSSGTVPLILPSHTDELYEAALALTEDEQLECALLGILPDEYIRRKRQKEDKPSTSSTAVNNTGTVTQFPMFELPRNLLPTGTGSSSSTRNRSSNRTAGGASTNRNRNALTKEELDIQLALLLSGQNIPPPPPSSNNPDQRP